MKRHTFDITAFVWGVLFLVIAAAVAANEFSGAEIKLQWILPAGLVTAGVAGIANAVRHARR